MSKLQCQLIATALEGNQTIRRIQLPLQSILFDTFLKPALHVLPESSRLWNEDDLDAHSGPTSYLTTNTDIFPIAAFCYLHLPNYLHTIIAMLSPKSYLLRYRDNEHGKIMTKAVRLFLFLHFLLPRQAFKGSH